jgi:rRNA maturation protein Nop10
MPYFLKEKSQGLYTFKNICAKVEFSYTPLKLSALCNNQGGEYVSREFLVFCIEASITHELTQAYISSHNGVSKCKNYTLLEKVHSMVVNAHIPRFH